MKINWMIQNYCQKRSQIPEHRGDARLRLNRVWTLQYLTYLPRVKTHLCNSILERINDR